MTVNVREPTYQKQVEASKLESVVRDARELASRLGLWPVHVNYWVIDHDEMNELIAYNGFQDRYPHWRWGMAYDRQQKKSQFLGGKAFEIVNNDDPANAFLQVSNTMADQKAVITHVEAHADFFANNEWFNLFNDGDIDASGLLAEHADTIESYMNDTDIDRDEVERFIDNVLCIEDTIDQHRVFDLTLDTDAISENVTETVTQTDMVDALDLDESVERHVFGDDDEDNAAQTPTAPESRDLLDFLLYNGEVYDTESEQAVEMTDWQRDVLQILRTESYYFAPQKMTKIMNEGWAAFYESLMMAGENFADVDEFVTYSDHMSKVLGGGGGLNPYSLGLQLWKYAENCANRREVLDKLLRVRGVEWHNFHQTVDMDTVQDMLSPDELVTDISNDCTDELREACPDERLDCDNIRRAADPDNDSVDLDEHPWKALSVAGMAERHYSLCRPENKSVLRDVTRDQLEEEARYILDDEVYDSVAEAIEAVDYTAGWSRLRDIRSSHNDATFIDEFLTAEFVDRHNYFAYEHSHNTGEKHVSSTDVEDIKRKLLLELTNFGKPTIVAKDDNFDNKGELLLVHEYNGVMLDMDQAEDVLKRIFELYGKPVNLLTVGKDFDSKEVSEGTFIGGVALQQLRSALSGNEPRGKEYPRLIRFDGDTIEYNDPPDSMDIQNLISTDVNYDTRPDEWLDS